MIYHENILAWAHDVMPCGYLQQTCCGNKSQSSWKMLWDRPLVLPQIRKHTSEICNESWTPSPQWIGVPSLSGTDRFLGTSSTRMQGSGYEQVKKKHAHPSRVSICALSRSKPILAPVSFLFYSLLREFTLLFLQYFPWPTSKTFAAFARKGGVMLSLY